MSNTETIVPKGYELKKKKPIFKKVWFWLLVIVAVIVIVAVSGGGDSETASAPGSASSAPADGSAEAPAEAPADDPLSDGGWTASDIQVQRTQFGDEITARVTNTEDTSRTGIFTLTIFGPDGARIGEAMGSANDVEAGQTSTVTFVGSSTTESLPGEPATYTYEFQNDL